MTAKGAQARKDSPLKRVRDLGQSIWLDYIHRSLLTSGGLKRLIAEDGLSGVTSNPAIFEKAIDESTDYDGAMRALLSKDRHIDAGALYEGLAIEDVCMAADLLRDTYDETEGLDGYVSLEVSPRLARDTAATIAEAQRLWKAVGRPNVMIKVPAAPPGIPAVESLIAAGLNINITLMFSLHHYEAVSMAYIRGLEKCAEPRRTASVASFFVSRVDTAVDRALDESGLPEAQSLKGKIAVANAKVVYDRFRRIFDSEAFTALRQRGARLQKVLWASTGTKNPAYSDLLYVENLIGADTINTLPPVTLDAFRDHGRARPGVDSDLEQAYADLRRLKEYRIDLDAIGNRLQEEGIAAFSGSYDKMLASLERKRQVILSGRA